ncbi:hypothetical protein AGMMS50293_20260 [Spirochaetia bacterium]|nr:hypothetical protein AGMMS50293_20260 [Spirochaetia bacterium]
MTNTPTLALLAVFSSLAMNLMFQCGLGIRGIVMHDFQDKKPALVKLLMIFVTVLLLWLIFAKMPAFLSAGFFVYVFLFPASSLAYYGFEYLACRFILKGKTGGESPISFCDGLAAAALFITLNLAANFVEAVALDFGFILGILLSLMILSEIRRHAMLEAVPQFLRGSPLVLISMGLLSLIFSSASVIFFTLIGG